MKRTIVGLVLVGLLALGVVIAAEDKPALLGFGVKSCQDFMTTVDEREAGIDRGISDYRRYEDWMGGFVSGLNLATGQDVLRGAGVAGALRRIQVHCENKRRDDFFTAAMDLVKTLSQLR